MARPLKHILRPKQRIHKLVILRPTIFKGSKAWICQCDCGCITKPLANDALARGRVKSCGCLKKRSHLIHGEAKHGKLTAEYRAWHNMKTRCLDTRSPAYKDYGKRGIKIYRKWGNNYQKFLQDVGRRPSKKHSLDRINNKRGYYPGNVRWATKKQQARNRRKATAKPKRWKKPIKTKKKLTKRKKVRAIKRKTKKP